QQQIELLAACGKELDLLLATCSFDPENEIYLCFGALKQKKFIYGKYTHKRFGAHVYENRYTKQECADKACERDIASFLSERGLTEYSRLITCERGVMRAILLSKEIVSSRKEALADRSMAAVFPAYQDGQKYFCHHDAKRRNFICDCGEELLSLQSEKYRHLVGMDDQKFLESHLPGML
ncbi:MAG TPA: hypothetical protein PKJ16_09260, partial [Spirochaetota bacterium]|nr:hypothetical protein [Spirochaetota bacterium]